MFSMSTMKENIVMGNKAIVDPSGYELEKAAKQKIIKQSFIDNFGMMKSNGKGYGTVNPRLGAIYSNEIDFFYGVNPRGIKEKLFKLNFQVLREISKKVGIIRAIQNTRKMQIKPFAKISYHDDEVGIRCKLKDKNGTPDRKDLKIMSEIEKFFIHCGYTDFKGAEERDITLLQALDMLTSEMMTIDQIAISLRRNKSGKIIDFWILDGEYIKMIDPKKWQGNKNVKYVQEINGKIFEEFTSNDIIFACNNPVVEIINRGYGNSYVEQCMDLVTGWLFAMSYNKEVFNTSAMPKGFLAFEGDKLDQGELEELQRQWLTMFRGIKGLWRTPFLQHNAKWVQMAPSNQDMQWNEYTQILASWVCAIHGIDSAEMGMRLNQAQNVLSENQDKKIAYSLDRGLRDLLIFHENWINKIVDKVPEWEDYKVEFTGLEKKNQRQEVDIDKIQTESYMTINEKRAEHDLKPIEDGDVIANPTLMQMKQAKMQQEQAAQFNQGEAGGGLSQEEEDALTSASDDELDDTVSSFKSFSKNKKRNNNNYIEIEI